MWRGICLGFVGKAETEDGKLDAARRTLQEARALSEANRYALRAHTILLKFADINIVSSLGVCRL